MAKIDSILVVGGGVAGLTTAAALHQHDLPVELVERRDTWWAPGAGFLVHGNALADVTSAGQCVSDTASLGLAATSSRSSPSWRSG